MQTFQTAAVVGLIDNMSGPLKTLSKHAKDLAKTIEAGKLDASGAHAYAAGLRSANAAAKEHLNIANRIHATWKGISGLVAGVAAGGLAHGSIDAIKRYAPLESQTRYQKAIGNYSDSDMASLDKQMKNAVDKWGMKLLDTKEAQQVFTTRNFSAPITEAATNASIILGRAMNTSAVDAGKMIEGAVFGQGIHLKDPATARLETMRAADMAAIAAKKGAMTPEDIKQLNIYGMAPAHAAGLTPEQVYATGMTFKRANIDGTQAGTFLRAASSRLVAPTTMGRDALALMLARQGKTLDDFTGGTDLTAEGMDRALAQNGKGRRLGAKGIASFNASVEAGRESENPEDEVYSSRAAFAAAARKALEDSGQTFDKGEVPKIVAHMLRLRDIGTQKIKAGELYDNILHNATQQEKIKILGDKQGGRAGSLDPAQYDEYKKAEAESAGYAQKIAEERMLGFAASLGRLESSFDNFSNSMVQANEKWLTPLMNSGANLMNAVSNMSDLGKEALTAAGAIAGIGLAAKAASTAMGIIGGLTGGGTAAGGAAAAAAAGGSVFGAGAAPVLGLLGATAATTALATKQLSDMTREQRAGVATNDGAFDPDRAMAAAIMNRSTKGRHGLRDRKWHPDASSDPIDYAWNNGVAPVASHVGMVLGAIGNQAYDAWHGAWADPFGMRPTPWVNRATGLDASQVGKSTGWQDSTKVEIGKSDGFKNVEVTGTVTGTAELHNFLQIEVKPTAYFEALVQRAENTANMAINGKLGTSMQGPGDNNTKASGGALTGTQP